MPTLSSPIPQPEYEALLTAIKERVRVARQRAIAAANEELLRGYWEIGHEILRRQDQEGWGAKVIDRLATDLRAAFPGIRGFSRSSLKYMRQFAAAWPDDPIGQGGLGQISWTHHIALLEKLEISNFERALPKPESVGLQVVTSAAQPRAPRRGRIAHPCQIRVRLSSS